MYSLVATKLNSSARHFAVNRSIKSKLYTMSSDIVTNLKELFLVGVGAVQPKNLFNANKISVNDSTIICNFNENRVTIDISGKRCHLVGFGKAVYGMTSELTKVLGDRLQSGMISVPLNIDENFRDIHLPNIQVFQGAKNNLPDENAQRAAAEILNFTKTLDKNDILFVLVSGGGSALLPLPCEGLDLKEKLDIIKKLANKGATISDINRVRIDLSQTKGGKLADCARNAGAVITFIISDIIGDPLDLIASGPTVIDTHTESQGQSIDVLKRFDLWNSLPEHIQNIVTKHATSRLTEAKNVQNLIIASNEIAVNAVHEELKCRRIKGIVLSTEIAGNVIDLSAAYFELSKSIEHFKCGQINENQFHDLLGKLHPLHMRKQFLNNIVQIVKESMLERMDLCVIGAGEPTVEVIGNGIGGRNQELALRFSQLSFDDNLTQDVFLLCAGTDGIDGPTTAAGAIGGADIIRNYLMAANRPIDEFLRNNDSFQFYSNLNDRKYHIVTGHTGTNVMDLHFLYFKQR